MQDKVLGSVLSGLLISILLCNGCGGTHQNPTEIQGQPVAAPLSPAITSFQADPPTITRGEAVALSWAASNATTITITPDIGSVTGGSVIVSPSSTTTYTAVAKDANGMSGIPSTVTITVNPSTSSAGMDSINHIVIMLQENRSFDNYFGTLNEYRKIHGWPQNVDGLPSHASNTGYGGVTVESFHLRTMCTEFLDPSWNHSHRQFNFHDPTSQSGKMDGFVATASASQYVDSHGTRAMGYYTSDDLPYYAFMASQFATSNRWFAPVLSRSIINRLYDFAATSAGYANRLPGTLPNTTIFHLLESAGVSWKIYVTDPGATYITDFQPFASQHSSNIVPASEFAVDAKNGNLPAVAWIESGYRSGRDEHPDSNIQKGAFYAAGIINSLMQSASWADSVFILSYDEPGGTYDHVSPPVAAQPDGIPPKDLLSSDPIVDFNRDGFRIPLLVISPFTRPHYVSQTPMDTTAILKLIETRFHLPPLTARDASQPDMSEFFDFDNVPWRTPPTPPDQPTDGACYYDHLP